MSTDWCITHPPHRDIYILSDSKYAVNCIKGNWRPSKHKSLIRAIQNDIRILARDYRVKVYHIPGHKGIDGNEQADALAKSAARNSTRDIVIPISFDTSKVLVSRAGTKLWQKQWSRSPTQLLHLLRVPDTRRRHLNGFSRRITSIATQVATGHFYNSAKYQSRVLGRGSALCPHCNESESMGHILFRCPQYTVERQALQEVTGETESLLDLFNEEPAPETYRAIAKFLTVIGKIT